MCQLATNDDRRPCIGLGIPPLLFLQSKGGSRSHQFCDCGAYICVGAPSLRSPKTSLLTLIDFQNDLPFKLLSSSSEDIWSLVPIRFWSRLVSKCKQNSALCPNAVVEWHTHTATTYSLSKNVLMS
ncbi:hypothetical protein TNCV_327971 [Trichonephila clavipes]|nr:hypothetical protein TNCV_327971 [Trichonephila clavipes]